MKENQLFQNDVSICGRTNQETFLTIKKDAIYMNFLE